MAITIACPHCKTRIQVRPEHSGRQVACPRCKGDFTIPVMAAATRPADPRLASPTTPPGKLKPVATPIQAQPASTDESWSESVSSGASTGDPLDFLNGPQPKHVKPASVTRGVPGKSKSFADTIATATGNLFGSQLVGKNAQPGITATQIGAKLNGLPSKKRMLLGCGGLLVMLMLCSGLLSSRNSGMIYTSGYCHAMGELADSHLTPPPIKEALRKGRRVWRMEKFHFENPPPHQWFSFQDKTCFAVFHGNTLESVIMVVLDKPDPDLPIWCTKWFAWDAEKSIVEVRNNNMQITRTWRGRADKDIITLVCEIVNDYNSADHTDLKKERVQVVADVNEWKANWNFTQERSAIRTESNAREFSGPDVTYSADGKKATYRGSSQSECSGKVFNPSPEEIRTMILP